MNQYWYLINYNVIAKLFFYSIISIPCWNRLLDIANYTLMIIFATLKSLEYLFNVMNMWVCNFHPRTPKRQNQHIWQKSQKSTRLLLPYSYHQQSQSFELCFTSMIKGDIMLWICKYLKVWYLRALQNVTKFNISWMHHRLPKLQCFW